MIGWWWLSIKESLNDVDAIHQRRTMFKKLLDQLYNIYEIIFTNISFFSFLYMKFHEPSVKKEINMAEISPSDKILHIGCGAIPYSLIIFSKETHAQITGIDNQTRSITHAKKFIADFKNIHVEKASGETYDVSPFDIILISYGVGDIEAVLKNTLPTSKKQRKDNTQKTNNRDNRIHRFRTRKLFDKKNQIIVIPRIIFTYEKVTKLLESLRKSYHICKILKFFAPLILLVSVTNQCVSNDKRSLAAEQAEFL